jgi:F-type H+-transporting ATPase subunit gamma
MINTTASLRRKIDSAGDLQSVVRTMKAISASSIGQYENAVRSLDDYYRTVQLGLGACLRDTLSAGHADQDAEPADQCASGSIGAVVFGSDQGLVGQFNDAMADFVVATLNPLPGKKTVWAIGERIAARLAEADGQLALVQSFTLPGAIGAIAPLVGQILTEIETETEIQRSQGRVKQIYLFYQRPLAGVVHAPVSERLLPLDAAWQKNLVALRWPGKNLPEVMNHKNETLLAFVREYLFVSLFRACTQSLASENASRLAAMQRAESNIDDLLEELNLSFHRLRQSGIDEELFDVISGFEALPRS